MAGTTVDSETQLLTADGTQPSLFSLRRPRDARAGLASGGKSIAKGIAMGAAGLVVAPAIGAVQNGAVGFGKGVAVGVVGALTMPVAGVVVGAAQVVRGVANTPEAIQASGAGKAWDMRTRTWIDAPATSIVLDDEVTQAARTHWDGASRAGSVLAADEDFYALLGVPRDASPEHIKKQYYMQARRLHPDKNPDDQSAKERFQKLGEAYQVLSNAELRAKYDAHGAEGLDTNLMDGALFFAMLFGSDRFEHLIGELMIASTARAGGELSIAALSELQAARERKLTQNLSALLRRWVEGDELGFKEAMHAEAHLLVESSYGSMLLATIGRAYEMQADRYIGNFFENGLASLRHKGHKLNTQFTLLKSGIRVFGAQQQIEALQRDAKQLEAQKAAAEAARAAESANTSSAASGSGAQAGANSDQAGSGAAQQEAARAQLAQRAALEEAALPLMLDAMWAANVVDIESMLARVCQNVLGDETVDASVRRSRALALKELGRIFRATKGRVPAARAGGAEAAKKQMEDAMMQVVERKFREDDAAHGQ